MEQQLPIDQVLPELTAAITAGQNVILHAPPGAGKTTRVPLALLELLPPEAGRIIMLEPRRLAAVSAARWMAASLGEEVGKTVGYSIRFESCVSTDTRIEVVTEGILTRRLQSDPLLEGVDMVIFDEFHERSIHADLGLALCLDVQSQVRDDLRILVMSATLECQPLSRLMNAPIISSEGVSFPVEDVYLEERSSEYLPRRMTAAVQRALIEREGDILVFLPGAGEIGACAQQLADIGVEAQGITVHQLYGDLPFDSQQKAIQPGPQRKVVLATSIAETSLTIQGVRVVIDSGLSRRVKHDQSNGMNRMVTVRASRASALQRRGRAGRVAPGACYRLYSRHSFSAMTPHTPPEIFEADLSPLVLELAAWGNLDPTALAWLDPPPEAGIAAARNLLQQLGALDHNFRITACGRQMAALPLHPRLSRLLLRARELKVVDLGCDLAALLSERDIFRRKAHGTGREFNFDVGDRVEILREWRSTGRTGNGIDSNAIRSVDRVSRQLQRLTGSMRPASLQFEDDDLSRLLLTAYPDRVAQHRDGERGHYLLSNGRGACLAREAKGGVAPLLIATSVDGGGQGEGIIHMAASLSEKVLRSEAAEHIYQRDGITWDEREGRVTAVREECFGALRLSCAFFVPQPETVLPIVVEAVRISCMTLLDRQDSFYQLQARVRLVGIAYPTDGWPDVSDAVLLDTLEEWLAPHLTGRRTAQQLAAVDSTTALFGLLDYRQRQSLEQLAPTHLVVPSGSHIRIDYSSGDLPVLAVKLQELFGLADSPTVAGGRVQVLLHLLSPAGRPLQVTKDLKGFWNGSYHQVKKEMKGRYPKHPWPDDPWSAPPTKKVKSKM
ncbi:ATP-dependent helicase HrpB [Pelotalea chapellei]|uniref:ATP-dependent helicase HrpB n=1 Tax=Pelotalea chapellei TaxID=44671 RepID=A0ABS5U7T1_9BACT|nr:ATP-dependent helicase HrpB [Pelotalea chapellei]MBT1071726.1 ATP-dependent helicase HrpB [Pelotalea chapellei]